MLTLSYNVKFSANTAKQQTVGNTASPLDPIVLGDAVKVPENILVQALSTNVGSITIGFDSGVTAGGAGIELPPGANVNLPTNRYQDVYVISAAGGELLNIIYSQGAE